MNGSDLIGAAGGVPLAAAGVGFDVQQRLLRRQASAEQRRSNSAGEVQRRPTNYRKAVQNERCKMKNAKCKMKLKNGVRAS